MYNKQKQQVLVQRAEICKWPFLWESESLFTKCICVLINYTAEAICVDHKFMAW